MLPSRRSGRRRKRFCGAGTSRGSWWGFLAGGEDEYSHHSRDELRDLIERRRAEGWQFMLIGAEGFDPYAVARGFGIDDDAMVSCGHANGLMLGMIAVAEIACDFAGGLSDRSLLQRRAKTVCLRPLCGMQRDLFENEISDEEIERAMRVCTVRGRHGTAQVQRAELGCIDRGMGNFPRPKRAAPEGPEAQYGIAAAERERAHRQGWRDYDSEILEPRRRRARALFKSLVEAPAERSRQSEDGGVDDPAFFSRLGLA